MPTQNLRVGFSAMATSFTFSRHSLATTPAKNLITGRSAHGRSRSQRKLPGEGISQRVTFSARILHPADNEASSYISLVAPANNVGVIHALQ
jgi:hypothetical protein